MLGDGRLARIRGGQHLLQVEGLVAVLSGIEMVHARGVTGQGCVNNTRVRVFFEELKEPEKKDDGVSGIFRKNRKMLSAVG